MSSPTPLRPARAGRLHPLRLGSSASYLFLTLLAANQAAARETPSLPYLKQGMPMALRFAAVRVRTPAPPPLALAKEGANQVAAETMAGTGAESSASASAETTDAVAPTSAETGDRAAQETPGPAGAEGEPVPATPGGEARFLPDTFAPPLPPVRVEDLLPYFLPEKPARSRAGYELK